MEKKLKEISKRNEIGYTCTIYGNSEKVHEQMRKDIAILLHICSHLIRL